MKENDRTGRRIYEAPTLNIFYVLMEDCMAAGSKVNFESTDGTPLVEDQVIDEQITELLY